MQIYKAPLNDYKFLLNNFLELSNTNFPILDTDFEISDLEMVLEEAAKICEETLLPLNQVGDNEGCIFDNGKVTAQMVLKRRIKILGKMDGKELKLMKSMVVKTFLTL